MEISFSDIDVDDLVGCSELFVSIFKEPPWNEDWEVEDAFERLGDFLACPKTIAIKAESGGHICGFFPDSLARQANCPPCFGSRTDGCHGLSTAAPGAVAWVSDFKLRLNIGCMQMYLQSYPQRPGKQWGQRCILHYSKRYFRQ